MDVDVVVADTIGREAIVGECKWRESFDETEALATLRHRSTLLAGYRTAQRILFTKHPVSAGTRRKLATDEDAVTVSADDLFE